MLQSVYAAPACLLNCLSCVQLRNSTPPVPVCILSRTRVEHMPQLRHQVVLSNPVVLNLHTRSYLLSFHKIFSYPLSEIK